MYLVQEVPVPQVVAVEVHLILVHQLHLMEYLEDQVVEVQLVALLEQEYLVKEIMVV
tara:strand:+ start:120 stop:290 length:171 start_codon:yes stop_codon:yes gene_type:complete